MQQAKSQFCAVAEHAVGGKPQVVTKHGRPFVVIVGAEDWKNARPGKKTLLEALRACPVDLSDLDLTRSKELPRPLSL